MKNFLYITPIIVLVFSSLQVSRIEWKELEQGLNYSSIISPQKSTVGDSKIEILKINPRYFKFNLLAAGEKKVDNKPINKWCSEYRMIAGVNASMFQLSDNYNTSTGYMKNYKYINNGSINSSYKNIFVFNSKDTSKADAHILDITCENWEASKSTYNSFSQSIRMIDCAGKNTWQQQEKKWSMVLLGEDQDGNILFIFSRSPYRVRDFISILQGLPIQLKRLMYLEGGPEASFYINHPLLKVEKSGSFESGFNENDANNRLWDIPNVIAISKK